MGRKKRRTADDRAVKESLAGLRDVLDLTLTRVLENDLDREESQAVLSHLKKELQTLERGTRRASRRPGPTARKRRAPAARPRRRG